LSERRKRIRVNDRECKVYMTSYILVTNVLSVTKGRERAWLLKGLEEKESIGMCVCSCVTVQSYSENPFLLMATKVT